MNDVAFALILHLSRFLSISSEIMRKLRAFSTFNIMSENINKKSPREPFGFGDYLKL